MTFGSIESSQKIRDLLNRKICHEMRSKVLTLDYVEKIRYEEKLVRDSKIECTSKTATIRRSRVDCSKGFHILQRGSGALEST